MKEGWKRDCSRLFTAVHGCSHGHLLESGAIRDRRDKYPRALGQSWWYHGTIRSLIECPCIPHTRK